MAIDVFQPAALAGIRLKNRIIRSATHDGLADAQGFPSPAMERKYRQLARGGVGLIITGYASVQPNGRCHFPGMPAMDRDASIEPARRLVDAVHALGTPIVLQLGHCGRQTRRRAIGEAPVAPSAIRDRYYSEDVPRAMSEGEILELIANFTSAIVRARAAGFDGVQLHAAHGYLLAEFLSAYSNRRSDAWGGRLENRFRIVAEILRRARPRVGELPILVKLNAYDGRKGGMRLEEATRLARWLEAEGCAAIEVSCGTGEDGLLFARNEIDVTDAALRYSFKAQSIPNWLRPLVRMRLRRQLAPHPPTRLYNVPAAQAIKAAVSIPVIAVGGIRTRSEMEAIIGEGQADFVALCRPLILEPDLVERLRSGRQSEARCLNCSFCALGLDVGPARCHLGRVEERSV